MSVVDQVRLVAVEMGLAVGSEEKAAILVRIPAEPSLRVEILVPHGVREWFITVYENQDGRELFTDSCEHYATQGETGAQLDDEMIEEIVRVMKLISGAELRVGESPGVSVLGKPRFRHAVLEARSTDTWVPIFAG